VRTTTTAGGGLTRRQLGRLVLAVAFLAWWWSTAVVSGHAALVRSIPAARAELRRAPASVQLWFNERLEPVYSSLSVVDQAGRRVDDQDVRVGPEDTKLLSVSLPTLAPGSYTVRFRVLSIDGHVVQSEFPFTIRGEAGHR
jgi:copper resistance protein C